MQVGICFFPIDYCLCLPISLSLSLSLPFCSSPTSERNPEIFYTKITSDQKFTLTTFTSTGLVVVVVMSSPSERPVPRRESPWGRPDGDTRQPKAHRCNDRVEDVVQACFEGNPFKTIPGPFKLFWRCMRSKPGEEPTEPFTYLELDPPKREEIKLE